MQKRAKNRSKVGIWDIFCTLWMEHISKTSMEICDTRWRVKSKSTIHVSKMWDVCNPCYVFICRVTPPQQLGGFWFLRYVYSFGEVCHRWNSTYLKTVLRQVVVDMAGPGFHIYAKLPFEIYVARWLQCEENISKSSHVTEFFRRYATHVGGKNYDPSLQKVGCL